MLYDRTLFTALLFTLQTLVLLVFCDHGWKPRRAIACRGAVYPALSLMTGAGLYALCRFVSDARLAPPFLYGNTAQLRQSAGE